MALQESPLLSVAQEELPKGAAILDLELTPAQIKRFSLFCTLLLRANEHMNLTTITEPALVMRRHILDSLTVFPAIPGLGSAQCSLVDVGSGAGLPGLPVAIAAPLLRVTLIDSVGKKIRFIDETVERLGLENVRTAAARVENIGATWGRDHYDMCIARAVADTPVLVEYCAPLVRCGGKIVLYKNGDPNRELEAALRAGSKLGCHFASVFSVPTELGVGQDRFLLILEKSSPTPTGFPRRIGVARKHPL